MGWNETEKEKIELFLADAKTTQNHTGKARMRKILKEKRQKRCFTKEFLNLLRPKGLEKSYYHPKRRAAFIFASTTAR